MSEMRWLLAAHLSFHRKEGSFRMRRRVRLLFAPLELDGCSS